MISKFALWVGDLEKVIDELQQMQKPWKEYLLPLECLYLQSSQIEHHKKKEVEKEPFFLCLKDHLQKRMYPRKIRILMHQNTLRRNAWYLLYVWPILSVLLQYRIFFAKFHSICLCSKSAYTFELECKQPSFAVLKTLNMLSCKNFHGWKNHLRVLHMLELLTILLFGKLPYLLSFWSRRRQQFNSIERGHRHCLEIDLKMRTTSISWQSLPNRRGILWKKKSSLLKRILVQ